MPDRPRPHHFKAVEKEQIPHLPMVTYSGPVTVIANDTDAVAAYRALRKEKLLGFDTETRPAFKKGESYLPSLIQLAAEDMVYIFQLHKLSDYNPLKEILQNDRITKVGVATHDDIIHLNKIFPFEPKGFLDLRKLASSVGLKNNGLRNLAAAMLGKRISKRAQTSNWSNPVLQPYQILYAATDAWVCREIYFAFRRKGIDS